MSTEIIRVSTIINELNSKTSYIEEKAKRNKTEPHKVTRDYNLFRLCKTLIEELVAVIGANTGMLNMQLYEKVKLVYENDKIKVKGNNIKASLNISKEELKNMYFGGTGTGIMNLEIVDENKDQSDGH